MRKGPPLTIQQNQQKPMTQPLDIIPALCGVRGPLSSKQPWANSATFLKLSCLLGSSRIFHFLSHLQNILEILPLFRPFFASSRLTLCCHVKGKPPGALENKHAIQWTLASKGNPCSESVFFKSHQRLSSGEAPTWGWLWHFGGKSWPSPGEIWIAKPTGEAATPQAGPPASHGAAAHSSLSSQPGWRSLRPNPCPGLGAARAASLSAARRLDLSL